MSSLQSFDTLLPNITIKCISPPSQTPLCCVYDGSRFRVLHQKQAFSLPSWQSGQRIGCILLGKWVLQMKIQIHKFGFSCNACYHVLVSFYRILCQITGFFIIILFLQTHDIHANSVYDHQSPNQNYGSIGPLFVHAIKVLMQIIPTHNQNPQAVIESQC